MKRFFFLFVLLGGLVPVMAGDIATTISLEVKNGKKERISYLLPVNHTVFWGAVKEDSLRGGVYHFSLEKTQTGFVDIRVLDFTIRLFVQEGDHLKLFIDQYDSEKPLRIEGNNNAGQELFSALELSYPGNVIIRYKKDTTASLLEKHIEADKEIRLNVFRALYRERKIDKAFMDFIKLNLDYYHASVMSEAIAARYAQTGLPHEHPSYMATFPADMASLWEKLYKQYSVDNAAALQTFGYNEGFNLYASNYINGYLHWIKYRTKAVRSNSVTWEAGMKETIQTIHRNLSPEVAEFLEAGILYAELSNGKNFGELLTFSSDFRKRYPSSSYTGFLEPMIRKAEDYVNKVKVNFTSEQKLIQGYQYIDSFRQLMTPFLGKVVFIEFWASWCITCKDQFDHEKELYQFLQNKGVEHLYISMDEDNKDKTWQEMIKYYDLRGNHIRANAQLIKDLSRIFWQGRRYALPLYVVISRSGYIVEFDTYRPSERKRLYDTIEKYVK